jgi:signal transduction histidine kinase
VLLNEKLNSYYRLAKSNGGVFTETSEIKSKFGTFWSENNFEHKPMVDLVNSKLSAVVMLYNRLVTDDMGNDYMIILNAELSPVDATVKTLNAQFYTIAFVMIIGAFVIAFIISKNISKPIQLMNRSARKLAEGRYDADFSVEGYREIVELSESLEDAANKLSKLDSLQRELIANVSHDLRTPLTLIKGYGEVMRDIPDENTSENLQVIVDEATHLSELVNDLLDLSRIHSGARVPEFVRFNLTETVRDVMRRYDKLVKINGFNIEFLSEGDVYINADRMMIIQVIYNLINNAVNYAGDDKRVTVEQKIDGSSVLISVRDNGEGIPPEKLDSIWDRYYKVDRVHKRAKVGTGLGLSIVKGSLELHNASYGVESAVGHGSRFWFKLPIDNSIDKDEGVEGQ